MRLPILVVFICLLSTLTSWGAQAPYRHKTLLSDRFIHEPVANEDCTVCHDLHFPKAPGQVARKIPGLCFGCHEDPVKDHQIAHAPVQEGECLSCHYPHSAPEENLLITSSPRLCTGCHPDKLDGRHGDARFDGDCLQCHDPHASASSSLLKATSLGQCGACHSNVGRGAYTHSALDEYECRECHNPHTSPPEPPVSCNECHEDRSAGENIHPPLEDGCDSCHLPHSGSYAGQTTEPVPDLCVGCHDAMGSGDHGGINLGLDCVRCHDPHSTDGPGLLTQSALGAPCASCHVEIIKASIQHTPVRNTKCSRCHDPHSPDPTQTVTCRDCHQGILDARYDHEPAVEGCGNCHDTHGSDFENHLVQSTPALCLQCHPEKEKGRHGSVTLGSECIKCHDPHSALQPKLLTIVKEAATCESCHRQQRSGPVLHPPLLDTECDDCHDPHGEPVKQGVSCTDCHGSLLEGDHVHDAAEEDCTNCHESHSGQVGKLLKAPFPDLCLGCHDEKEGGRHGSTVLSEQCGGCHEPHSSSRNTLLKDLGERSCTDCHTGKEDAPHTHSALDRYPCQKCHNPHEDPPAMPPLACRECHTDMAGRSPAHGTPSYGKCVQCHDPHGSDSPSMLREGSSGPTGECLECHLGVKRALDSARHIHEPVAEGDCSDCHSNHDGEAPFTLERFDRDKNVPYDPKAYALCFQCHSKALVENKFTESETGFRHKRWNLHNLHVVRDSKRGYSCWVCHSPHGSRQPHLITMEVPFNRAYSLKIEFRETEKGGQCSTNCHSVQEYER